MSTLTGTLKRDGGILAPICAAHFLSHLYILCLPPLFPLLHAELGVSFAALGFLLTLFNLASGASQLPAGILVDRFGGAILVLSGLALEAGAILFMGLAPEYVFLATLAVVAGIGHSVFHPADYAILSSAIDRGRLGKAFGFLSTGISVGGALAPVLFGWLVDLGRADGVFHVIAGFMALGMIAVAAGRRRRREAGGAYGQG